MKFKKEKIKKKNSLIGIDISQLDLLKLKNINVELDKYINSIIKRWNTNDIKIGTIWFDRTRLDDLIKLKFVGKIKNRDL